MRNTARTRKQIAQALRYSNRHAAYEKLPFHALPRRTKNASRVAVALYLEAAERSGAWVPVMTERDAAAFVDVTAGQFRYLAHRYCVSATGAAYELWPLYRFHDVLRIREGCAGENPRFRIPSLPKGKSPRTGAAAPRASA